MPTSIVGWLKAQGLGDAARLEQWDIIEQELGHHCGLQNTLLDLAHLDSSVIANIAEKMDLHGSVADRMLQAHDSLSEITDEGMLQLVGLGEIVGDLITGQISEVCDLETLTAHEADRRKAQIPAEATHYVWAYQADKVNIETMTVEQKNLINEKSGEFSFAHLGSFIFMKETGVGEPPKVVGVNALGIGQEHGLGTIDRAGVS